MIKYYITILTLFLFLNSKTLHAGLTDINMFYIKPENNAKDVLIKKKCEYKIFSSEKEFTLPETPFQRVISLNKHEKGLSINIKTGVKNLKKINYLSNKNKYLKDSRILTLQSAKIKMLAKNFKNSKNISSDVEEFVYRYILDKKIGIPLISAESIVKMRAGDCTEHSVLTVSILRASGIPARAVIGLIFSPEFMGRKNVFVYHMWCEAFVNGQWKLLDATRPGKKNNARYIAFAYHSLKTVMTMEYAKVSTQIRNMTIRYIK